MLPTGSVITIEGFQGKTGEPKTRWFIYLGRTDNSYHIICTTTSRVSYYTDGNRKNIPHVIISEEVKCFKTTSVLDVMGVYYKSDKDWHGLKIQRRCFLPRELLLECIKILVNSDYVENWIRAYLQNVLNNLL